MTDSEHIERLFRENYSAMYRAAFVLLKDDASARDVVHDVFAALLNSEISEKVGVGYLMRSVRNRSLNLLRDMPFAIATERLITPQMIMADDNEAAGREAYLQMIARIIREELPQQCSRVMLMRHEEGKKYEEIAETLGISKVAVYKHLKRGLEIIRKKLNE